jgi:hypothetical protein
LVIRGGGGLFFDTPNANPFLDNRPGNSAPNGLEGNPGGSSPVFTITTARLGNSRRRRPRPVEIIPTANAPVPGNQSVRRVQRCQGLPLALQLELQPAD